MGTQTQQAPRPAPVADRMQQQQQRQQQRQRPQQRPVAQAVGRVQREGAPEPPRAPYEHLGSAILLEGVRLAGVKVGSAADPDGTEHSYQENLTYVCRHWSSVPGDAPTVHLSLERDRTNAHDPFAVRVMATVDDCALAALGLARGGADAARPARVQVGWLPAALARAVAPLLDSDDAAEGAHVASWAPKWWLEGPDGRRCDQLGAGVAVMYGADLDVCLRDPSGRAQVPAPDKGRR